MTDDEVDDKIDAWHFDGAGTDQTLWEYLGWTEEEYTKWAVTGTKPKCQ